MQSQVRGKQADGVAKADNLAAPKARSERLVHPSRGASSASTPERLHSTGQAAPRSRAKRGMRGGAKDNQSELKVTLAPTYFDPAFSAFGACW